MNTESGLAVRVMRKSPNAAIATSVSISNNIATVVFTVLPAGRHLIKYVIGETEARYWEEALDRPSGTQITSQEVSTESDGTYTLRVVHNAAKVFYVDAAYLGTITRTTLNFT